MTAKRNTWGRVCFKFEDCKNLKDSGMAIIVSIDSIIIIIVIIMTVSITIIIVIIPPWSSSPHHHCHIFQTSIMNVHHYRHKADPASGPRITRIASPTLNSYVIPKAYPTLPLHEFQARVFKGSLTWGRRHMAEGLYIQY